MLPDIQLDQITFEEMMEKAKNRIASCYPEWTDFNYHDPGITLLELFAWLKEIQQYEMNHIGDDHKRKYLKLLGTDIKKKRSAETFACVDTGEPVLVQAGCRLEAPGVPFETMESQMLPGVKITHCFGLAEKKVSSLDQEQLALGHKLEFYPFGREALEGTCFYVGFSGPLPVGQPLCLTFWTGGRRDIERNPAGPDTIPLSRMTCSFWNGTGYQPLEIIGDDTFGFLFDGQLKFRVPEEMKERKVDNETGYFLQFRLTESQYEMPPVFSFLDINTLKVRQVETVSVWLPAEKLLADGQLLTVSHSLCKDGEVRVFMCRKDLYQELSPEELIWDGEKLRMNIRLKVQKEVFEEADFWVQICERDDWFWQHRILGTGKGFPNESFLLDEASVANLELLVEEPECPGAYRRWVQRKDFSGSGPEDRHYCVDGMTGSIRFGDCFHGMAPEGRIILAAYERVLGSGGNVKAHKLCSFADEEWSGLSVTNPYDAKGGRDEESIAQAFARVKSGLMTAGNMVTTEDYERAVRRTPGLLIESCKALVENRETDSFAKEQEMRIVVKPLSLEKRPRLKPAFIENIRNYLEPRRMIGTRIRIISPTYIKLSVYLEVTVRSQYQGAQEWIEQSVRDYLTPFLRRFGENISYSGLYGHIDRLECVYCVDSLVLDAKGNGVRKNTYGDLLFPGNGISDEIEIQCSCSVEE